MKRAYRARKYQEGIGEPLDYDRDGQLQERKVTPAGARQMIATMQSLVPELGEHTVSVELSPRTLRGTEGLCSSDAPTRHKIVLYATGQNEGVLLHEIAHVSTPVVRGSGSKHIIHGAAFKRALLRYERIWRKHNKLRTRQNIIRVPVDDEIQIPSVTRLPRYEVERPYFVHRPRPESRLHRLICWIVQVVFRG